jgi:hypothetical protein
MVKPAKRTPRVGQVFQLVTDRWTRWKTRPASAKPPSPRAAGVGQHFSIFPIPALLSFPLGSGVQGLPAVSSAVAGLSTGLKRVAVNIHRYIIRLRYALSRAKSGPGRQPNLCFSSSYTGPAHPLLGAKRGPSERRRHCVRPSRLPHARSASPSGSPCPTDGVGVILDIFAPAV